MTTLCSVRSWIALIIVVDALVLVWGITQFPHGVNSPYVQYSSSDVLIGTLRTTLGALMLLMLVVATWLLFRRRKVLTSFDIPAFCIVIFAAGGAFQLVAAHQATRTNRSNRIAVQQFEEKSAEISEGFKEQVLGSKKSR